MARKYTASFVRKAIRNAICDNTVAEILVQFAEELEREEGLRKRYTEQDVRTAIQMSPCNAKTKKVLIRYAEYLERKNQRMKKYEYAVKICFGSEEDYALDLHDKLEMAKEMAELPSGNRKIFRREVGEWEEIS